MRLVSNCRATRGECDIAGASSARAMRLEPAFVMLASYMRRATNTVNYSSELLLAQGVHFG